MTESGVSAAAVAVPVVVSEGGSARPLPFWSFIPAPNKTKRPSLRVTSEFDSDSSLFFHTVSCKLFDDLAKLKLSFQNDLLRLQEDARWVSQPQLAFVSKYLSVHHDLEDRSTLLKASVDLSERLQLRASHDVGSSQGELSLRATLPDPNYSVDLSSPVPSSLALPKATFKFPLGEVSLEEKENDDADNAKKRVLSVDGLVKAHLLSGLCSAHYSDDDLRLRYSFKDDQMSIIPSISLPSNALSFAFKRRFGPADKLSYWYNFDVNNWSAVYKHTYGKDLKFKAGYDSAVRIGWASLWVGEENGKAKAAPLKMKIQFMLQVPQDDIKSSALMFRVKKRWDI